MNVTLWMVNDSNNIRLSANTGAPSHLRWGFEVMDIIAEFVTKKSTRCERWMAMALKQPLQLTTPVTGTITPKRSWADAHSTRTWKVQFLKHDRPLVVMFQSCLHIHLDLALLENPVSRAKFPRVGSQGNFNFFAGLWAWHVFVLVIQSTSTQSASWRSTSTVGVWFPLTLAHDLGWWSVWFKIIMHEVWM